MQEEHALEQTENLSELLRVRREKLSQLKEDGRDPFAETVFDQTHWSAENQGKF